VRRRNPVQKQHDWKPASSGLFFWFFTDLREATLENGKAAATQ
jgi:hypothetical protein